MKKHGLEHIKNVFNPTEEKLPQIVDYFVEFYGEEYRPQIEERIKNTHFIFYERGDYMLLERYFESLKQSLAGEFFDEFTGGEKGNYLFEDFSFSKLNSSLSQVELWIKDIKKVDKKSLLEFLRVYHLDELLKECKSDLSDKLKDKVFLDKLKESLKSFDSLYKYCYKDDFDYLNEELEKINKLLPNDKVEEIEMEFEKDVREAVGVVLLKLLKIDINYENIDYLDSIAPFLLRNILTNPELLSKHDKQEYLEIKHNLYGMANYHVQDINNLDEEEKQRHIDDLVDYPLAVIKEKLLKLYNKKQMKISQLKSNFEDVNNLIENNVTGKNAYLKTVENFKDNLFPEEAYNVICPGLAGDDKFYNIVFYNSVVKFLDSVLIHEINHSVSSFAKVEKSQRYIDQGYNDVYCKNGFVSKRYLEDGKGNVIPYFDVRVDYTPLNEAINEYLSQKICDKMVKDNFKIGRFYANQGGKSSYTNDFPLLINFFENNLQDIIKCNMSEDENLIYSTFGEENIDQIAQSVYNYSVLRKMKTEEYYKFLHERNSLLGKKDIFESLKNANLVWSEVSLPFVKCFKMVDEAVENIERYKQEKLLLNEQKEHI